MVRQGSAKFSPSVCGVINVGTTSTLIARANEYRDWLALCNDGNDTIYLGFDGAARIGEGLRLNPQGGSVVFDHSMPFFGEVNAISTGTPNLTIVEIGSIVRRKIYD